MIWVFGPPAVFPPLQLHGSSFGMNSGEEPKLIPGVGGGGVCGAGQEAEYNILKLTSSSHVKLRLTLVPPRILGIAATRHRTARMGISNVSLDDSVDTWLQTNLVNLFLFIHCLLSQTWAQVVQKRT